MTPEIHDRIVHRARRRWATGEHIEAVLQGIGEMASAHADGVALAIEHIIAEANRAEARRHRKQVLDLAPRQFGGWVREELSTHMTGHIRPAEILAAERLGERVVRERLKLLFATVHPGGRA